MKRFTRKILSKTRVMWFLTLATSCLISVLVLPWAWFPERWREADFAGIPLSYFISIIGIPALILVVLIVYTKLTEDADRHTLEFENE